MSGGTWDYSQYHISTIADSIESLIYNNDSNEKNEFGDVIGYHFSQDTIDQFKQAVTILKKAAVYAQRIDWLIAGDDGEDTFHIRLEEELNQLDE